MAEFVEPVRASVLLRLEGRDETIQDGLNRSAVKRINVKGLDRRFGELWQDGKVVGVGNAVEDREVRLKSNPFRSVEVVL
jgi:hypothetical protein